MCLLHPLYCFLYTGAARSQTVMRAAMLCQYRYKTTFVGDAREKIWCRLTNRVSTVFYFTPSFGSTKGLVSCCKSGSLFYSVYSQSFHIYVPAAINSFYRVFSKRLPRFSSTFVFVYPFLTNASHERIVPLQQMTEHFHASFFLWYLTKYFSLSWLL